MKSLSLFVFCCLFLMHEVAAQSVVEMLDKVETAIDKKQYEQAVDYFGQSIAIDSERSEMFYWTKIDKNTKVASMLMLELAKSFSSKRNYDKAYLYYKELTQSNPENIDYLEQCAEIQVNRGEISDALHLYEQILKLDADNLAANIFLGNYHYLTGEEEKKKLEEDYKKISSPTRMQYARYRDGLLRLFSTEYVKARTSLQRVIRFFPSTEAKKTLDKIMTIEKEVNR